MQLIWQGLLDALHLIVSRDAMVLDAAWRSLWISSLAVALATLCAIPLGMALARNRFMGKQTLIVLMRASMAFPTVFLGMVCYALFSRSGPLGALELLYTPSAIVFGEFLLAFPIITSLCHGAISSLEDRVFETAWTLGAGPLQRARTYLSEARIGITLALLTAFSRCVTELGIAMMVGGNIKMRTRTLSTATALETGKGEFSTGMAMGLILLLMAVGVTFIIVWLSAEESRENRTSKANTTGQVIR